MEQLANTHQSCLNGLMSSRLTWYDWKKLTPSEKKFYISHSGRYLGMDSVDIVKVQNSLPLFDAFLEKAFYAQTKGKTKLSARTIVENLRWYSDVECANTKYKISNNLTPRMSELSMELFPALNGFFDRVERRKYK